MGWDGKEGGGGGGASVPGCCALKWKIWAGLDGRVIGVWEGREWDASAMIRYGPSLRADECAL